MVSYCMEWPKENIKGAILTGFTYIETLDEIVGFVCARPEVVKKILFNLPNEFKLDFIPRGVGILRTAYVYYKPLRHDEIRMVNRDKTIELQIKLI